jgi:hypothetical protein
VNVIGKIAKFILNLPKMIMNALIVTLSVTLQPVKILMKAVQLMPSVMTTLGLSDGGLSNGMAIKSERMGGILPRGLVMLTIALGTDSNEGGLGRGICAGEICGMT